MSQGAARKRREKEKRERFSQSPRLLSDTSYNEQGRALARCSTQQQTHRRRKNKAHAPQRARLLRICICTVTKALGKVIALFALTNAEHSHRGAKVHTLILSFFFPE